MRECVPERVSVWVSDRMIVEGPYNPFTLTILFLTPFYRGQKEKHRLLFLLLISLFHVFLLHTGNAIAYIFTVLFSLSLFSLLWRTNGEKSIQYTGYWSTPITAEKKSVQGVREEGGRWTQRSITYSISRFHSNRPSKDRGLPRILHLSISYTYCDNESVSGANAKVTWRSSPKSTSTIKEITQG